MSFGFLVRRGRVDNGQLLQKELAVKVDTACTREHDAGTFLATIRMPGKLKKPTKLRRRPPANAPKPKVLRQYEKKIAQEMPRFEKSARNLHN